MDYTRDELSALLGSVGENVKVHASVLFFNPLRIRVGSNVRIDAYAVLSAGEEGIHVGDHVHVSAGVYVFGGGGRVTVADFAGLSSRVSLYTATDDLTEGHMTGPTVPEEYRKVTRGAIEVGRHVVIGTGAVVMPGVTLGVGAAVGALSFVKRSVPEFTVVAGTPATEIRQRDRRLLERERAFLEGRPDS